MENTRVTLLNNKSNMANVKSIAPSKATSSDFARETIKRMAMERISPTPENYTRIYNEIAQIPARQDLESVMKQVIKQLSQHSTEGLKWQNAWHKAVSEQSAVALKALIESTIQAKIEQSKRWPDAIRDLVLQWNKNQIGITPQYKKETLERLLTSYATDNALPEKIQALTKSWANQNKTTLSDAIEVRDSGTEAASQIVAQIDLAAENIGQTNPLEARHDPFQETLRVLQDVLNQTLNYGLIPRLDGYPELKDEATEVFTHVVKAKKLKEWQVVAKELRGLLVKVEVVNHTEDDIKDSLIRLLRLLIDNISELVTDDQWLNGQIAALQTILSSPLEKNMIADAERSLKEVIIKQSSLKHSLNEAKQSFKHMITVFIDRLGDMSDSAGVYQGKIEQYATQISQTEDITQIGQIVDNLMQDTRVMQTDILRSRDALEEQRAIAVTAEVKIKELESELTQLSEKVRVDQLTGTLNRRGLDDAFAIEIARAQRGETTLSVTMLDIDNFKHLNDTYGHEAGDLALKHLASVVKETVRPTDIVARFGGEEFVILLPNTHLEDACSVIARLQRDLTKKFFLQNNERLLLTFSAGVAVFKTGEDQSHVLQRADQAMYLAKRSGKNRVMTENDL